MMHLVLFVFSDNIPNVLAYVMKLINSGRVYIEDKEAQMDIYMSLDDVD